MIGLMISVVGCGMYVLLDTIVIMVCGLVFFFSSRRRHTRLQGDWSSDVCSSDLHHPLLRPVFITQFIFNTASFLLLAVFVPYGVRHLGLSAIGVGTTLAMYGVGMRSEERRVGKEGRSRGWPDH